MHVSAVNCELNFIVILIHYFQFAKCIMRLKEERRKMHMSLENTYRTLRTDLVGVGLLVVLKQRLYDGVRQQVERHLAVVLQHAPARLEHPRAVGALVLGELSTDVAGQRAQPLLEAATALRQVERTR